MSRHVAQRFRQVVAAGDDAPARHHHGTDGDFALAKGGLSLGERLAHVLLVDFRLLLVGKSVGIHCFALLIAKIVKIGE